VSAQHSRLNVIKWIIPENGRLECPCVQGEIPGRAGGACTSIEFRKGCKTVECLINNMIDTKDKR